MRRLRALLDYADFARNVLTRAIEFELADRKNVGEIVIVESRVKSPRSIVSKMLARRCREFSEIDDVVGVRVVCASLAETRRVAQRIERATQSLKVFKSQKVGNIERDERASITSVAGYKAMHMYLACPPRSPGEPSLGCEIQIRSIFQDAWARLSQHLSYKKSRLSAQVVREALSELAELRDKADSIVDKIASR